MDTAKPPTQTGPIALYVHIPFCETKCPYCDFNTYARIEDLIPSYVAALKSEIALWGDVLDHVAVKTIFLGGGTPSYLPAELTSSILGTVSDSFRVCPDAEVTLEANPGDLTPAKLQTYMESGLNRLSIGVQSLDDDLLSLLGRRHTAAQAVGAYRMSTDAGLDNVSVDLMYGLPGQTLDQWRRTLDGATELGPVHVSAYALTLEGGTPMEVSVRSGHLSQPDPDLAADMYLAAEDVFRALGYRHYEISNWALPGRESRHNLAYWRNEPYLGVGPGAHSSLRGHRFANMRSPREYVRRLDSVADPGASKDDPWVETLRKIPVVDEVEVTDRRLDIAETLMLGLRLDCGVGVAEFADRFGVEPSDVYGTDIEEFTRAGLLETDNGSLRLTPRGRLLSNEVFSRFFG